MGLPLVQEVKKSVINGKRLYMNPSKEILLAANELNEVVWKSFKIQRVKIEDFVSSKNGAVELSIVYTLRSDPDPVCIQSDEEEGSLTRDPPYPMWLNFMSRFSLSIDDTVSLLQIRFAGFKKKPAHFIS